MKKLFLILISLILSTVVLANEAKKYGAEITLDQKTTLSEILTDAESFVGKKVLVEGTVIAVCAKRGCWIELSGEKDFEKMRVKVNDGEIVFPMEAKGKKALVEGEVYSVVVEGESCGGDCEGEHKDENKEECKHEKNKKTVYMIKGLGAVIK